MAASSPDSYISRRPYVTMGLTVAGVLVLVVATQLVEVLFTVFAGILLAVFLAGVTQDLTEDTRLPRPLAVALTLIGLGGVLVGLWALAGPDISEQASALATLLPDAAERLASRIRTTVQRYGWMQRYVDPSQLLPPVSSVLGRVTNVFRDTLNLLVNGFIILFIGIYGGAAPQSYLDGVVQLVPPSSRPRARDVLSALGRALRWWLTGRLILMLIVGVLTAVGLKVVGIPSPIALGLLAALFSFVPYLGPVLSVLPALLVASLIGPTEVLYVILVYGAVQLLESYLISPLVQQQAVHIPPATVITAQFIGGVSAGAWGVLLATPFAIVVIVLVQTLYVEDVLGDEVSLLGEH
ncbi:AI-2E family transporter [Salinibacter ruber]|uniref:PurR-regulated permease PerM n=1 Tax=Salinibacter ruber TaxID=146919 RepID=A0A9X2U1S5_9BACT|nr:AI-2E family transporter [Salinibacter ruber]MCS3858763.1 putative PurR-regulated permease PerM [Salinibacter ruber]MCS3865558.1 putative PurR-regulated permease PerM [Salinibacter ruber]MCS4151172.1 putative PurR-regulated permease PerM [Salinibacter ruber]